MGYARFGSRLARDVVEISHDVQCLDKGGFWAVVVTFEGDVTCVRFATVTDPQPLLPGDWEPLTGDWSTSLDETSYRSGVTQIRDRIAAGEVYQACLCRIMSHPLTDDADLATLEPLVAQGNPAPHAGRIYVPEAGLDLLSASPEAFLIRHGGRIESRPIKGTATTLSAMLVKDYAENVMIADLVRNDLSAVCRPGTVSVDALCAPEDHPGLTHLVTTVSGELRSGVGWPEIMAATFPPGSVSGAPKSSALRVIADLETVPRGPYCGAIGWVDADANEAELAVGIRTFWADRDATAQRWLRFGTGGAITWGSDPGQEWAETELKAARLIGLASGRLEP
ncbi:MAG: anthranilate synthase component I family protein [Phycicoccus sp.]|nr:anthranilate synthase component I family protein [Phycicoccus sp.]